jgi:hypothetical protein
MFYTYIIHEAETIYLESEENWLNQPETIAGLASDIKQHNSFTEGIDYIHELKDKHDWARSYDVNYIMSQLN